MKLHCLSYVLECPEQWLVLSPPSRILTFPPALLCVSKALCLTPRNLLCCLWLPPLTGICSPSTSMAPIFVQLPYSQITRSSFFLLLSFLLIFTSITHTSLILFAVVWVFCLVLFYFNLITLPLDSVQPHEIALPRWQSEAERSVDLQDTLLCPLSDTNYDLVSCPSSLRTPYFYLQTFN